MQQPEKPGSLIDGAWTPPTIFQGMVGTAASLTLARAREAYALCAEML